MVTSKDITDKTGLSTKTLTRWHKRGIIPKPAVQTHPSGRGKIAYWPDWVLDRVVQIQKFRAEGNDLRTAARLAHAEMTSEKIHRMRDKPSIADILAGKMVPLKEGGEISLLEMYERLVLSAVFHSPLAADFRGVIAHKMREEEIARRAIELIVGGYNPVLTFDGTDAWVEPDFLMAQMYQKSGPIERCQFIIPLLPPFRELLVAVGATEDYCHPRVTPAPKIWVHQGDATVEYLYFLAGPRGFEIYEESATTIRHITQGAR